MTVSLAVPDILVARAQAGDEAALEALYRAFETPVYSLARRMLKRPEDAEDVVQETFLEVVRNIKQYRGEGHLWGWVRRIASTKALMRIRRDQVRATEPLDDEPGKPGMHIGANLDLERAFEYLSETSMRWCGCTMSKVIRTKKCGADGQVGQLFSRTARPRATAAHAGR
jgi:RNA polymerase sigma factor (sigma-70 family)